VLAALSVAVLWLVALTQPSEAATRGLALEIKASEAPNAPTVETVNLYTKSYALVIGINDYDRGWQRLSKAVSDARRVAKALEKHGFDVTLRTDLKSDDLAATLKDFFIDRGRDPNARLFVWFAGHGATVDGEGYLIPTDGAALTDEKGFLRKAISLRDFGKFARYAKSKHVFSVFDACFAGTIFNVARSRTPPAITRVTTEPVRQFLSSGDAGQEVSDNGEFASMFIEALEGRSRADANADGYLTGSEIGENLTYRMTNVTNNRQTPRSGKLRSAKFDRGDFVFSLGGPAKKQKSVAMDKEALFWSTIKDSKRASDFEAYLQQYWKGTFTSLARIRLNELKGTKVASVATPPKVPVVIEEMNASYVAIKTANLRSEPSTKSSLVGSLLKGKGVVVTGRVKGMNWYRLDDGSFVFGSLIKLVNLAEVAEQKAWDKVKDSTRAADFEAFLAKYPRGQHSDFARRLAVALQPKRQVAAVTTVPRIEPQSPVKPVGGIYLEAPKPGTVFRDCDDCPEMVVIPPGEFMMGGTPAEHEWVTDKMAGKQEFVDREKPRHKVVIRRKFAVGKFEVTRGQYSKFVSATDRSSGKGCYEIGGKKSAKRNWRSPGYEQTDRHPATCISWLEATAYTNWLSEQTGSVYRLLSETEFEYAARAGSTTVRYWGNDWKNIDICDFENISICTDDNNYVAPVGAYRANAFGLHDMLGNLAEHTEDCWYANYKKTPSNGSPRMVSPCRWRVLRGGSWQSVPYRVRSAMRGYINPYGSVLNSVGFRVARSLSE
jgi:formylglycine-generating enzyme required for sulfatase activity